MSKLLINQPPLQFQPSLAVALGVDEAIVIQQLHYWLENKRNSGRVDEQGQKWVFNTYEKWKEDNFPFWSVEKIQRVFLSLEKIGVVISAQLDAKKHDMTKFYRIDYEALCMMDDSILRPSKAANLHDVNKNTETTTETTTPKVKKSLPAKSGMDWMVAAGVSAVDMAATNDKIAREAEVANLYESAMGYNPLNWQDKDMPELLRFLMTKTPEEIKAFAKWSRREYSTFPPTKARQFPLRVKEFWPLAFADQTNKPYQPEESWL